MTAPPAPAAARRVHVLKCVQKAFAASWAGDKRHEVRRFDRPFVVGDLVLLMEYQPVTRPSGGPAGPLGWWGPRVILAEITHLTGPPAFGLPPALCVFSLGRVVCLMADSPHDETRPPVPSPSMRGSLAPDVLDAWTSYAPRPPGAADGKPETPANTRIPRESPVKRKARDHESRSRPSAGPGKGARRGDR